MGELLSSEQLRRREVIVDLENKLKELPQINLEVLHHFSNGIYCRELRIPKDTLLTGKIHKFECLNILLQGSILLFTEDGESNVSAPYIVVSKPGIKRVGRALTDTIWLTVHPNPSNTTNTQVLEDRLTVNTYAELEGSNECHSQLPQL